MNLKKSLIGVAAIGALAAGVAFAATTARDLILPKRAADATATTVTATWKLGTKSIDPAPAVYSQDNVFTSSTFNVTGMTLKQVRTAQCDPAINFTSINTTEQTKASESQYIEFSVKPATDFTVTGVSFAWGTIKKNDVKADVVLIVNGTTKNLATNVTLPKVNVGADDANTDFYARYSFSDVAATTGDIALRIYPYGSAREIGLANVVITGTVKSEEQGGETDNCHFHLPGVHELNPIDDDIVCTGNARIENAGTTDAKFGYLQTGTSVTFKNVHVGEPGAYKVLMTVDWSVGDAKFRIDINDVATGKLEAKLKESVMPKNSGWQTFEFQLDGRVSEGLKDITYYFTDNPSHANGFNLRAPEFVRTGEGTELGEEIEDDCYFHIPGTLEFTELNEHLVANGPKVENKNGIYNIGYVKNGGTLSFRNVTVHQAGVYQMSWPIAVSGGGDVTIQAVDATTNEIEASFTGTLPKIDTWDLVLPGKINEGAINLDLAFAATHGSWVLNFYAPTLTKIADEYACVSGISLPEGLSVEQLEGYDWAVNLPLDYSGDFTFKPEVANGTIEVKAGDAVITPAEGSYTIPAPAANEETIVTITLTPGENAYAAQTVYKLRLFHIGGVVMTGITIDGDELDSEIIDVLNSETNRAIIPDRVYTALPAVKATFIDGTSVDATSTLEGTTATYSIENGDKIYVITVEGIHIYTPAENDLTSSVRFQQANCKEDNTWFDGIFTIQSTNSGWGGTQFKFKPGTHSISAAAGYKIKQIVFSSLFDNYNSGKVSAVTSEGATVYLPTKSEFKQGGENAYNLVVNIENHVPGTPIEFTFDGGGEIVAWFDVIYEKVALTTAPTVVKEEITSTANKNHAVVKLTFDREIESATALLGETTVTARINGTVAKFSLWNLEYNQSYALTIPAEGVKDIYGNTNSDEIPFTFEVGENLVIENLPAERFIVVSTVDELRSAVAFANENNKTADSERTVIFMHNGDYDLGNGVEQKDGKWDNIAGNTVALHLDKAFNVSLIGESQEGVLIHGTLTGISYPVFSTRNSTNIYMENFTVRNDYNFPYEGSTTADRGGVAVAHYGGNLDIMKNVTLQSIQDTQVTGERGYYLNCTIEGKTDYICGGGDHYYDHCTFINHGEGGFITAPATSAANEYGYVLNGCTIEGDANYYLGRPWQNEPRCYWLNTTMKSLPKDEGWGAMSNLPTHFYEYNSMDADGTPLALSVRVNSPSSTNHYSPELTEAQAAVFTIENVLGGDDSWLPTEMTALSAAPLAAPADLYTYRDGHVDWSAVEGAVGYMLYKGGNYLTYLPGKNTCSYTPEIATLANSHDPDKYTVYAINANGARGIESLESEVSGIADIEADGAEIEMYNLQGVRMDNSAKGTLIRVTIAPDGTRTATKVYVK